MKTKNRNVKVGGLHVIALLAVSLGIAASSGPMVNAWGPERPTYTMNGPADHATFNSITDNPALGDERDFVRIVEVNTSNAFTSELALDVGKEYAVYIYFHNDASATYNTEDKGRVGVAYDTRVISYFPESLATHERGKIDGIITSSNANPKTVWDEAYITAKEAMTLHYIEGTAKIYNQWGANGTVLDKSLFTGTGVFIGMNKLNGMVPGCDEYSGQIMYRIRTEAVEQPDEPDPEPEPEPEPEPTPDEPTPEPTPDEPKPETPQELPETGPAEVALAAVIVIAVVAGFVYWRKTSHAVKKVTRSAKGRGGKRK